MATRKTGNYDEYHLEWLKNSANAAAYLNSVMEEYDRDAFVQALRDIAYAQDSMMVSDKALSKRDSLKFSSISKLLHGMGLRLTVRPDMSAHGAVYRHTAMGNPACLGTDGSG